MTLSSAPPGARPRAGAFRSGLLAALPIALGYFPIAFSFGVAATRAGLSGAEAVMLSVLIFAGAAQFLALALVTSGAPLVVSAVTLVAMNLRHVMYAPALLEQAGGAARTRHAWAWAWGLTDEVFGAALGAFARGGRSFSEAFMGGLGLGAYGAWIGGTAAGAFAGGGVLEDWPAVEAGLGFMLPALFLALLLSILRRAQVAAAAVAIAVTVAGMLALSPSAGILGGILAGALAGVFRRRQR
ncbi:AzlC family ABC transporter permease [Albidovulum sp.]|uniref:AzlC family ABC transporter permease n=1 Tax=Albidovulum sp. TaxID=1872424 RepID=UPI0039B928E6